MLHRIASASLAFVVGLVAQGCGAAPAANGADGAASTPVDATANDASGAADSSAPSVDVPRITSDDVVIATIPDVATADAPSTGHPMDSGVTTGGCPPIPMNFMYASDVWFRFADARTDNSWAADSGKTFGFVIVDTATNEVIKSDLTTIPSPPTGPRPESGYFVQESDGNPCGASLNHARSYQIAYFIDSNGNGVCDGAPTDRVWLIDVTPHSFGTAPATFAAHYDLIVTPLTDSVSSNPLTTNPAACRLLNSLVLRDH